MCIRDRECVCQLFDRLAAGLGRHEPLLRELQGELFASIYEGFKPVAGGCVKGRAWFEVAQALQAQVDAAQRERREWHAERTELRLDQAAEARVLVLQRGERGDGLLLRPPG